MFCIIELFEINKRLARTQYIHPDRMGGQDAL